MALDYLESAVGQGAYNPSLSRYNLYKEMPIKSLVTLIRESQKSSSRDREIVISDLALSKSSEMNLVFRERMQAKFAELEAFLAQYGRNLGEVAMQSFEYLKNLYQTDEIDSLAGQWIRVYEGKILCESDTANGLDKRMEELFPDENQRREILRASLKDHVGVLRSEEPTNNSNTSH